MTRTSESGKTGLWLIGACGSVATCVAYGLAGLRQERLEPLGVATEFPPLSDLDLVPLQRIEVGGCDVSQHSLSDAAAELVRSHVLSPELVAACASEVTRTAARRRPGFLDVHEAGVGDPESEAARRGALAPREQVQLMQADIAEFARETGVDRVVVVNVASTEAQRDEAEEWGSLERFEAALDAERVQPSSILYAYAALDGGHPFVNFTPSRGASLPALRELALARGAPHCGNDGKTGETLVKTVLAPLFKARALRVLAWQGYNMLGNRDGAVLADPLHKQTKVRGKDDALRRILGDPSVHTHVGIDYVPSLADWKTAWDFVHFEGFLNAKMSLQFTWTGSDSALAAPLVIDLVRLVDLAARRGESGVLDHLACYFKAPLGSGPADFASQYRVLVDYVARTLAAPAPPPSESEAS